MLVHIQILRFVAALAVVVFHVLGAAPDGFKVPENAVSHALSYGGRGVDLFFVISGFIIFYATRRGDQTPAGFLRRRVERIVPLYFFVIFAVTLLAMAIPSFDTPDWYTPRHILKSLAFVAFTDGDVPVVAVGWSLEYEMYFYLAVAMLMAVTRDVWRHTVTIFCALAVIGCGPALIAALGNYAFFVDPIILEFVFGIIIADVFVNHRLGWPRIAIVACAVAALLIVDPGNRAIVSGIPAACLVAAAAFLSRSRTSPSRPERMMARLGDASYAIYLAQVETVTYASRWIAALLPAISPALLLVATTSIVVALGLALNILVERPLLRLARGLGGPRDAHTGLRPADGSQRDRAALQRQTPIPLRIIRPTGRPAKWRGTRHIDP